MTRILLQILLVTTLFSFLNLFPTRYWPQEVNKNLGGYYLTFHILSLFLTFIFPLKLQKMQISWRQRFVFGFVTLVMTGFYIRDLFPFYFLPSLNAESSPSHNQCGTLKIYYSNIEAGNEELGNLYTQLKTSQSDIVVLLEITSKWEEPEYFSELYPFRIIIPQEGCFGMAIYSRYAFLGEPFRDVGSNLPPVIVVEFKPRDCESVTLAVFHALPPLSGRALHANKVLLRRIATDIRHREGQVVVVGDMNATPFSSYYKRFQDGAKLSHALSGHGLVRTWNAKNPLFRFMIDHVFYKGGLQLKSFEVLDAIGSDHYPLLIEFGL